MDQAELDAIEKERLDEVESLKEYPPLGNWDPGSPNCYVVLDRIFHLAESIEDLVLEHPTIKLNSEWYQLAHEARTVLYRLHAEIEEMHTKVAPTETDTFYGSDE